MVETTPVALPEFCNTGKQRKRVAVRNSMYQ